MTTKTTGKEFNEFYKDPAFWRKHGENVEGACRLPSCSSSPRRKRRPKRSSQQCVRPAVLFQDEQEIVNGDKRVPKPPETQ